MSFSSISTFQNEEKHFVSSNEWPTLPPPPNKNKANKKLPLPASNEHTLQTAANSRDNRRLIKKLNEYLKINIQKGETSHVRLLLRQKADPMSL